MEKRGGGELAELKKELRTLAASRSKEDLATKRELFKRIISYMGLSIDVSALFTEMTMATATADVATKKMLYHYITHHAHHHPELALLAINTLLKDCRDDDPTIRGLALRSLCALRVPNLLEYLTEPLRTALDDAHPYVRRTAVMGVLKVHYVDAEMVERLSLLESLRVSALHDPDPQVAANCLSVLVEIEGYDELAKAAMLIPVLNRIRDFSEWALCVVLDIAARYRPADQAEVYDVMNVLENCLGHANSAVVLATVKVFLHLTLQLPEVHQQVYERIKAPLLTLIASACPEIAYAVVAHLRLLVQRVPVLFATNHKSFYCRFSDPPYIKKLKLEMLTAVADSNNVYEVVTELSEYVADVDQSIARRSVEAVGRIALETPDADGIIERLLQFVELGQAHVTAETLLQMKDLLRRRPQATPSITAALATVRGDELDEPRAKAAYVWLVGELGDAMDPYLLEPFVECMGDEQSAEVKLAVLAACARMFFLRPAQCQRLLGGALAAGAADPDQDVHDRALLYYRLLKHATPEAARDVLVAHSGGLGSFAESHATQVTDTLFHEFNSLSVLYYRPAATFAAATAPAPLLQDATQAAGSAAPAVTLDAAEVNLLGDEVVDEDLNGAGRAGGAGTTGAEGTFTTPDALAALLNLGAGGDDATGAGEGEWLATTSTIDPPTFQRKWSALAGTSSSVASAGAAAAVARDGVAAVKLALATRRVQIMASGGTAPHFKLFAYAQPADGAGEHLLAELLLNSETATCAVTIKSDAPAPASDRFAAVLQTVLTEMR